MFKTKKTIIYITQKKLRAGFVTTRPPLRISNLIESEWSLENLGQVLAQFRAKLKAKTVRLLLADDLAYVVSLNIPPDLSGIKERKIVAEKIVELIPEALEDKDWDYKEVAKKGQEKEIIAFAPVKERFAHISIALEKAGLEVEAIEPEIIAKSRHEDPVIGLALKKDLKGKDEKVLNLKPLVIKSPPEPKQSEKEKQVSTKPTLVNKKLLIVFLIILLLSSLTLSGIFFYRSRTKLKNEPETTPTPVIEVSPSPEATPLSIPDTEVKLSDYSIQVLNGSGLAGEADFVEKILTAEGFDKINVGNADSYNYTDTQVELKENVPVTVFEAIDRALNDQYTVVKSEITLPDDSGYDIVVTIGEKK